MKKSDKKNACHYIKLEEGKGEEWLCALNENG